MATLRPADMVDTFLVLILGTVAVQPSTFLLKLLKFLVVRFSCILHVLSSRYSSRSVHAAVRPRPMS